MDSIIKMLKKKTDVEVYLPQFVNKLAELQNNFSDVRIAFNYLSLYEVYTDISEYEIFDCCHDNVRKINECIKSYLIDNHFDIQEAINKVTLIRKDIMKDTEALTSFIDKFKIIEYIFNRNEAKYTLAKLPDDYSDEVFINNIIAYICKENDNSIINSKIKAIVGQLPVRITKDRFFELVKESFDLYKESNVSSLDDFIYQLKTSTAIINDYKLSDYNDELNDIYNELKAVDFDKIDNNEYKNLKMDFDFAVNTLNRCTDLSMLMQNVVNDIISLLITSQYSMIEYSKQEDIDCVINTVYESFDDIKIDVITKPEEMFEDDELFAKLSANLDALVGVQEEVFTEYNSYSYLIDDYNKEFADIIESTMLINQFNSIKLVDKLISSESIFISIDNETETNDFCTPDIIEKKTIDYINTFNDIYNNSTILERRAAIGSGLACLPVFFNNLEEFSNYMSYALVNCQNKYEKTAVFDILQEMINS